MISEIKKLDIGSVILESHDEKSIANITVSFNTEETLEDLKRYNVRVFISTTSESAMSLDYISQRYNEFLLGEAGTMNSSDYNNYLRRALGDGQDYLSTSTPFSPFSIDTVAQNLVLDNGVSKYGKGKIIPDGVMIYDQDLRTAMLLQDKSINVLKPIKLQIPPFGLEQMSCYVFIYDNELVQFFGNNLVDPMSLSTQMSLVERRTFTGFQTEYVKINKNKPFVGMKKVKQLPAPDNDRLQTIRATPQSSVQNKQLSAFDMVKEVFLSNSSSKSQDIENQISKDNYFTDLWLTKDDQENVRLLFSIDTDNFLRDHGIFPVVYNSLTRDNILSNSSIVSQSKVLSVDVYRKALSNDGFACRGKLGTIERGERVNRLNVDSHNSKKPINSVKEVSILLQNGTVSQESPILSFFEGYDVFSSEDNSNHQQSGLYEYSVTCQVLDDSPQLMREIINTFIMQKARLEHVYNSLTSDSSKLFGNRPTYNLSSGRLNVDIRSIFIPHIADVDLNTTVNAEQEIIDTLGVYQGLLQGFSSSGSTLNLVDFYKNKLKENGGLIDPSIIKSAELLIDFGIKFVYESLLKIFPADPLGRFENSIFKKHKQVKQNECIKFEPYL